MEWELMGNMDIKDNVLKIQLISNILQEDQAREVLHQSKAISLQEALELILVDQLEHQLIVVAFMDLNQVMVEFLDTVRFFTVHLKMLMDPLHILLMISGNYLKQYKVKTKMIAIVLTLAISINKFIETKKELQTKAKQMTEETNQCA